MKLNGLFASAVAAFLACSGTKNAHQMSASHTDSEAARVIQQYVAMHKGWRRADYKIEKHEHKNTYVVYFIHYLPEQRSAAPGERKPLIAGGGESFAVYYDPAQRKVIKEMHFQ